LFAWIGRQAYCRRWWIVAVWALVVLAALPILPAVEQPLKVGGFSSPDTEAAHAADLLQRDLGFAPSTMLVLFQSDRLSATNPEFERQVAAALRDVKAAPHVVDVILPSADPSLIAPDNHTAYAIVGVDAPPEEAQRDVPAFEAALHPPPDLTMLVAGAPVFYRDIEQVSQQDLRRAELIAFPFALAALIFVFGSVVAACAPLVIGGVGVAAILLTVYWAAHATDLSIFVLNLATMLGLGLAIDYSLFVTSRFPEELRRRPDDVAGAVERTIATAGRAVFFSGTTVLIGLAGLALFSFMFLRSVGIAGVIVVLWSTLAALTLLPALLGIAGGRINRLAVWKAPTDDGSAHGFWATLSRWVMAHPLVTLAPTLTLLVLVGLPFRDASISSPDATILPESLPSRQAFDRIVDAYGPGEISPFLIVLQSPTSIWSPQNLGAIDDLTRRLASDRRVARVQSVTPANLPPEQAIAAATIQRGLTRLGIAPGGMRLANDHAAAIVVTTRFLPNDDRNKALLQSLRATPPGGDLTLQIGGGTAEIVDVVSVMYHDFPLAAAAIVAATYLVLLVLFRSVVLPLKAIVMNALSILASFGALVWVFQEGHLSGALGFTPLGFVEASLPVIMFCVLFGLSMDYEVFLLTRIREEWDRSRDNTRAVAVGMQRSGRIITSAALLVVVVTASFVSADVVLIKALGFGIALAVLLDATVIRALVVPATMRLLGRWNWWLPSPVRRLLPARGFAEESL
jgi:RND superfamily putative drug exporter